MEKTAMASSSPNIYSWKNKITATSISSSKFQLNFSSNRKFSDFSIISLSQSHYCCNSSEKSEKSSSKTQILSSDDSDFAFRSCKSSVKLKSIKLEVNGSKKANGRRMNLKSLFNKESLWRRILFASRKVRSIILLNVTTLIYASNIPVVKEVEAIMDPAAFNAVRFAVSVIPFLPFIFRARRHSRTRKAGLELGLWVSLGYLMQALGLLTSDAGRASFISMLTVIVVPLLDGLLGAVVSPLTWFGATMSVIGVGMLESSGSPPSVGDFLNFMSAVFFGIHMLRTERISRITEKKNFLALLGYEVCVVAFLSVMWYLLGGWFSGSQGLYQHAWTWEFFWASLVSFPWIPALYTGIFSTGLCLWVEMTAMRDVSATETAIIYGLEPVWGAGFAWFLLGERWGTAGWIGAALVLGGSLTVQMFGSMPHGENERGDEKSKTEDHLTASPVVVRSREDDN